MTSTPAAAPGLDARGFVRAFAACLVLARRPLVSPRAAGDQEGFRAVHRLLTAEVARLAATRAKHRRRYLNLVRARNAWAPDLDGGFSFLLGLFTPHRGEEARPGAGATLRLAMPAETAAATLARLAPDDRALAERAARRFLEVADWTSPPPLATVR